MRSKYLLCGVTLLWGVACGRTEVDTAGLHGGDDTGALERPEQEADFALSPDVAFAGEVMITSLTAADPAFDFSQVQELVFYGGEEVVICATRDRGDELLVSVGLPEDAADGTVDLVIRMANGDNHFLSDALTIIGTDPAE